MKNYSVEDNTLQIHEIVKFLMIILNNDKLRESLDCTDDEYELIESAIRFRIRNKLIEANVKEEILIKLFSYYIFT